MSRDTEKRAWALFFHAKTTRLTLDTDDAVVWAFNCAERFRDEAVARWSPWPSVIAAVAASLIAAAAAALVIMNLH